jgi:hypothetical protein
MASSTFQTERLRTATLTDVLERIETTAGPGLARLLTAGFYTPNVPPQGGRLINLQEFTKHQRAAYEIPKDVRPTRQLIRRARLAFDAG